ncbi:MAG: TAXI family TRAP transporter solute-binding subunit, partial [Pirellulales bacterium]
MTDKLGAKPKSAWLLLCTVIVALGVVAMAGARAYNNHAELSLVISGGSNKGVYFSVANALSDVSKQGSVSTALKAIPSPGSVENVRRLATREADFALLQNDTIGDTSTRGIARLYEETLHLIARKDSAISCMHDLEGKSVGTGSEGSGTSRLVASLLDFSLGER